MRISQSALIHALCFELKLSRRDAQAVLSAFIKAIKQALSSGDEVRLRSFGAFRVAVQERKPHDRPPRRKDVRFRSSKRLKSLVQDQVDADPALALLLQQIESDQAVETMIEQHERWCENKIGERPDLGRLDLEGSDLFGAKPSIGQADRGGDVPCGIGRCRS